MLRAAPAGTGIIAGGPMRAVFETLGMQDVVGKVDRFVEPLQHGTRDLRCAEAPGFAAFGRCAPQDQGLDPASSPAAKTTSRRSRNNRNRCRGKGYGRKRPSRCEQIGSPIRRESSQRETLIGLGLNKINRVRKMQDNPSTRGMIAKVAHLVRVVESEIRRGR